MHVVVPDSDDTLLRIWICTSTGYGLSAIELQAVDDPDLEPSMSVSILSAILCAGTRSWATFQSAA